MLWIFIFIFVYPLIHFLNSLNFES